MHCQTSGYILLFSLIYGILLWLEVIRSFTVLILDTAYIEHHFSFLLNAVVLNCMQLHLPLIWRPCYLPVILIALITSLSLLITSTNWLTLEWSGFVYNAYTFEVNTANILPAKSTPTQEVSAPYLTLETNGYRPVTNSHRYGCQEAQYFYWWPVSIFAEQRVQTVPGTVVPITSGFRETNERKPH